MRTALLVLLLHAAPAGLVLAQRAPIPFSPSPARLYLEDHRADRPRPLPLAEFHLHAESKDHTVAGILIGAGIGFAAGWAFYDTLCEAVDNQCSDSRVRLLLIGGVTGGAIGGLIGSLVSSGD